MCNQNFSFSESRRDDIAVATRIDLKIEPRRGDIIFYNQKKCHPFGVLTHFSRICYPNFIPSGLFCFQTV